jgi:tetratricopeptide (TPR) repeat protein
MSARLPSRWLFATALVAVGALTVAASAAPPGLPTDPQGQGVPQPAPSAKSLQRLGDQALPLEEEQVSEHGDPRLAPPAPEPLPPVERDSGLPRCGLPSEQITKRCLLFSIHPLFAFYPAQVWVPADPQMMTLPSPCYLEHPPQYFPPAPAFPLTRELATQEVVAVTQAPEQIGMPEAAEYIGVMPTEEDGDSSTATGPRHSLIISLDPLSFFMPHVMPVQVWASGEQMTRVYNLRHASAADVANALYTLTDNEGAVYGGGSALELRQANVVPEPITNRLLVRAAPDHIARVLQIIAELDVPTPEQVGMPEEAEQIEAMPDEVEQIEAMPSEEESEPQYEFLAPWIDFALPFPLRCCPRAEITVRVENEPGSLLFGLGLELSGTGTVVVNAEPLTVMPTEEQQPDPAANEFQLWDGGDRSLLSQNPVYAERRRLEGIYKALQDEINRAFPDSYVHLELVGDKLVVSGEVKDAAEADRILTIIGSGKVENPAITNLLHTATQVQLDFLIAEVEGKAVARLGLDPTAKGPASRWVIEIADEGRQKALLAGLNGLRARGHAKLLAQPQLMTLNGHPASFLNGGECAVLTSAGVGQQVGVQFEEFGTRVTCRPVIVGDGKVRLEVEPEISELCETASDSALGIIVPGRSTQRVHTTADLARGQALVISGPKAGGNSRLVVLVTPTVVEPPAATGAARTVIPQCIAALANVVCNPLQFYPDEGVAPNSPRRIECVMQQSEDLREIEYEMEQFWLVDQPSHLTPAVSDLLSKCQRELSRGHYAAAEELAQEAIERDRGQVIANPLVSEGHLLERVKEIAVLPLGTASPCGAKAGRGTTVPGEAKAIGSKERMVQALMEEYNAALKMGRYRDAEVIAMRAAELDSENPAVAAAVGIARMQQRLVSGQNPVHEAPPPAPAVNNGNGTQTDPPAQAAAALARFHDHFKAGRYEEARVAALQALAVVPGDPAAAAALRTACEALARQPQPEAPPQCTYVGSGLRPVLPPVDPAVVRALQKILIEADKTSPAGGTEEAEPRAPTNRPAPRH